MRAGVVVPNPPPVLLPSSVITALLVSEPIEQDMVRLKLTSTSVRQRCRPPDPDEVNGNGRPAVQRLYWDTELRGFGLLVGKRSRTFIVQKTIGGRSVRVTIGRLGAWTVAQARRRAREIIVQMDQGIDPNRQKAVPKYLNA